MILNGVLLMIVMIDFFSLLLLMTPFLTCRPGLNIRGPRSRILERSSTVLKLV